MMTINAPVAANAEFGAVLKQAAATRFVPLAYYDKYMDCIRIELRDCSLCEERLDELLTVLYDNHPQPGQNGVAGLMIKGIKHLFKEIGLPLEGVLQVTEVIDRAVKSLAITEEAHFKIIGP